jgi:NitT/TauT family transport system permease protein
MKEGFMKKFGFFASFLLFLIFWEITVQITHFPSFILPPPSLIIQRTLETIKNGLLFKHTLVTLKEIIYGIFLGTSAAFILGYLLAKSRTFEKIFSPYIVGFQAIPIVALAPLIIIWFGQDFLSKSLISALTLFFPVLLNTITGFREVDQKYHLLFKSLRATSFQTLTKLEIPAAFPILLTGLKIGVTLSVIGAVIGEFVAANQGLGFLVTLAGGLYDTPLRFVAFFTLALIALTLYSIINLLEKILISWKN